MMCDRCDQPIDPADAKPYEVPGATGPGVTVYLCRERCDVPPPLRPKTYTYPPRR